MHSIGDAIAATTLIATHQSRPRGTFVPILADSTRWYRRAMAGITPDTAPLRIEQGCVRLRHEPRQTEYVAHTYLPDGDFRRRSSRASSRSTGATEDGAVIADVLATAEGRVSSKTHMEHARRITPASTARRLLDQFVPQAEVPLPEVALRRRGRASVLRRRQAERRRPRLLRRVWHDCPRGDAAQQAGRRPSSCRSRHQQRGGGRRAESTPREGPSSRRPRVGALGDLRVHHQAADRGRHHRQDPDGEPIKGDYKFTDEFPMADGFEENVEFFTLTYEAPLRVASNREFAKIAPLLWMRAGSRGRRIDDISAGWDVADTYGVLADLDHTEDFLKAVAAKGDDIAIAYHRHRRGPPLRVRRPGAARPRRARPPLRGVPAQLRDRVRAGCAVKFTLQGLPGPSRRRRPRQPQARARQLQEPRQARNLVLLADRHHWRRQDGDGRRGNRGAVLGERDVRLRPRPGCGRALVLRRPEPERADSQPAHAGVGEVHLREPRPHRAAVREAAPRPRQGVLPEHAEAQRKVAARARTRRERRRACRVRRHSALPDLQGWTIWETLANTIEADDLTLYLVLDEAHRGFNTKTTSDKPTIVRRLVNGTKARPPIPIVWGISATIAALRNGDEAGGGYDEPARTPVRARRPGAGPGVGSCQRHPRPRHPGRGRQLRLRRSCAEPPAS